MLMAENVRTMLPMLVRHKVVTEAEVDVDTLAERLRRESRDGNLCLMFPLVVSVTLTWPRASCLQRLLPVASYRQALFQQAARPDDN